MSADDALDRLTRLDVLARVGMAARGLVYVILGLLVLNAGRHSSEGQTGAFAALTSVTGGWILLCMVAAGLFAYGLYRFLTAALDADRNGSSWKGIADRTGHLGVAITYFVFAYLAAEIALGLRRIDHTYANRSSRLLAQQLLELPLGAILLGSVGIGFAVSMVLNIKNAVQGNHMRFASPRAPRYVAHAGRLGMITQAAIAGMIGWSMIRAAWFENSRQAKAMGGALQGIRDQVLLYDGIAIGLILFGLFSLMLARWRIVPKIDVLDEARDKVQAVADVLTGPGAGSFTVR
ncbi:DUF1206 domain-containing protein [Novosphingobium sp.]|uniref:DUF1206 domain-containing protein n=1 Tax=Novosphingobium sp. TaxID=1874826 RepID=UPI0025EADC1F|nr:DUF1206 domain-containing protein [Novosphingobium sp.]